MGASLIEAKAKKQSITFRLPIIEEDMQLPIGDGLDYNNHVEAVVLMSRA